MAKKTTRWRQARLRAQAVRSGKDLLYSLCSEKAFLGSNLAQRLNQSPESISDQNFPLSQTSNAGDEWPDEAPKLAASH